MSPAAAIGMGAGVIALAALAIIAALNAASRRIETLLADALDHSWIDDLDDEYRQLIEENA